MGRLLSFLPKTVRRDVVAASLLLVVATILVFPNLGSICLWEDEANTALVAVNITKTGLPLASDGKNLVSIFPDHRDIRDGLYIWQPWLPNYLAAGSMSIFGANAFGARFAFALLFVALVAVSYFFFRNIKGDQPSLAQITALFVATSVPLLLHARQCRYYILVPLFNLLIVRRYLLFQDEPRLRHVILAALWFTALFNSFAPGAVVLGLALGIDFLLRKPDWERLRLALTGFLIYLVSNLPLAVYTRIWDRQFGVEPGYSNVDVFGMYLLRYLLTINNYFFPMAVVVLAIVLGWKKFGRVQENTPQDEMRLFVIICLVQLTGFSLLSDYPFTRYLIGLAPFVAFFGAKSIMTVAGRRHWLMWGLVCFIASTNILNLLPLAPLRATSLTHAGWTSAGINSEFLDPDDVGFSFARGEVALLLKAAPALPLADYVRSLLHPPQGPIDMVVNHLNAEAAANDVVKVSYEDMPLMYHTGLSITSATEIGPAAPQWIIQRHFNPNLQVDDAFLAITDTYRYTAIELPVGDVQWNNQPDPLYHFYTTPTKDHAPYVRVLHREAANRVLPHN